MFSQTLRYYYAVYKLKLDGKDIMIETHGIYTCSSKYTLDNHVLLNLKIKLQSYSVIVCMDSNERQVNNWTFFSV